MSVSLTRARYYLSTYTKLLVVPGYAEKCIMRNQSLKAKAALRPVFILNKTFLASVAFGALAFLTLKGSIPNFLSRSDIDLKRACVLYTVTACASALFTAVKFYQVIHAAQRSTPVVRSYH